MSLNPSLRTFIKLTRDLENFDVDDFVDNAQLSKNMKIYLRRTVKYLKDNKSEFITPALNDIEIKDVYPNPIWKLFNQQSIKKLSAWFMDITSDYNYVNYKAGKGELELEVKFAFMVGMLNHYIVLELLKPILFLLIRDNIDGRENYQIFGFTKSELTQISDATVLVNKGCSKFLGSGTVDKKDIEKMEWYLQRLFRTAIHNRIIDKYEEDNF